VRSFCLGLHVGDAGTADDIPGVVGALLLGLLAQLESAHFGADLGALVELVGLRLAVGLRPEVVRRLGG
jgi:hypothetical protein